MQYSILFPFLIFFYGCSNTIPPKVEYRINPNIQVKSLSQNKCKTQSIKIAKAFSKSNLLSKDMSYGLGDSKQYVYANALWSISPNRAITTEYLSIVRDSKLFESVQIFKSRSRSDIILEINIEDFMQYFNDDSTKSYANVVISVSLISTKTNTVFASQTFQEKLSVSELNSNAGVDALNKALEAVLMDTNTWLGEVCK